MVLSGRQSHAGKAPSLGWEWGDGFLISVGRVFCVIGAGSSLDAAFAESNPVNNQSSPTTSSRSAAGLPVQPHGHAPQEETGPLNTGSGGAPAASPQGETPPGMQATPSTPKDGVPARDRALPKDPERR
jgi:hypothetical protein